MRMQARRVCRVTACVAIEFPEERELDNDAATGASAVVSTVSGISARQIDIDGVVAIMNGSSPRYLANLREDGRSRAAASGR